MLKNRSFVIGVGVILLSVVLGCGLVDRIQNSGTGSGNSNKSLIDKGVDTVLPEETTGVPECDEVMDMIAAEANNPDDGYITKAVKSTFLNKIKESIKKSIDESKNNNKSATADIAKTCRKFKDDLVKYKAEEEKKKGQ